MNHVIHWFRRDLRLDDNTALAHAITHGQVIPLFILDPNILNQARSGEKRVSFLLKALQSLDARLQNFGTRLHIKVGSPLEVLTKFVADTGATALYANADYSPYARKRDARIEAQLNIPVFFYDDAVLLPPGTVLKNDGKPYVVYTPFWKNWKSQPKPAINQTSYQRESFAPIAADNTQASTLITQLESPLDIGVSEKEAQHLLKTFQQTDIKLYAEKRNDLPINPFGTERPSGTSYLSPYLRLGILSPRQAYWAARESYQATTSEAYRESIETWVSELAWREFYVHILYFFPHVLERDFVDTYLDVTWNNDPADLSAWKQGMTGYPIIDAPMRQLNTIGWMPNRARMIVASFLTKDLLIHWRYGEQYFMEKLIDGDPAANNGGWQWAAGTGTDAQPYFRIFNPVSQSEKFAMASYLKYWIPELQSVPEKYIHAPWQMPNPPKSYPAPIVDHAIARERTLQAFKAVRGASS